MPYRPPLWLLVLVTLSGTLAMHMFVPALGVAASELHAPPAVIQGAIGLYILGLALGQERFSARKMLGLGIVVAGSVLLGAVTAGMWQGAWRGDLLFLTAVCSWAVYTVLVQRWKLPALDVTLAIALMAAPFYLPLWWAWAPSGIASASWGAILFQMLFHGAGASVLAGFLYTRTVAALGPGPTTMLGAAVPALAALWAWAMLGEALPPLGLAAVLLVSLGMAIGVVGRPGAR